MPNLNDICSDMIGSVDYAFAAAVVDQETGLLLGVAQNTSHITQTFLDAVAASAVEMFRGKAITTAEKMIAELRGESPRRLVQEIQMTTESTYHFMCVVPDKPTILAVLVAGKKINLGMGWASLRSRLKDIAAVCP
ncbi:MAG: hypothetical protein GC149_10415 [Gammaproteobacteria bacterium]|nr:hypothetical protein [Gammaproteobacteria bacterium]